MRYGALILCAVLFRSCTLFNRDDAAKPMELVDFEPSVKLETVWRKNVGAGTGKGVVQLQPALDGDVIYVADAKGRVQALDRFSGARLWRVRTGDESTAGVGNAGGVVVVGIRQGGRVGLVEGGRLGAWRNTLFREDLSVSDTGGNL